MNSAATLLSPSDTTELPADADQPCPVCAGPTIPADPARPEEHGNYCEPCGKPFDLATGQVLL